MQIKLKLKNVFIFSFLLLAGTVTYGQSYNIDYYGIVSTEIDSNMAKMTSDLYYTQLTEINNFNISDKRQEVALEETPDSSLFSETSLSFYTVIKKNPDSDSWITVYHVVDKKNNEEHTKQKNYDSFYKILMESKNILKETIKNLIENDDKSSPLSTLQDKFAERKEKINSTESLSGTWTGEDSISKIVIMRGGRGFIILKNGASMNVSITIDDDSKILVTQNGKANASFFPELPRNQALQAAISSQPVQWILTMVDSETLSGIKNTLVTDGDDYKQGQYDVIWTKTN